MFDRDYPVIEAGIILVVVFFIVVNLTIDIIYMFLDPRVRYD